MNEKYPDNTSITDEVRESVADKAAVQRSELWAKLGYPTAKEHMNEQDYLRDYRGRHWACNPHVFEQVQYALRIVFCPKCVEVKDRGAKSGTRFFITIEDDVMTVFKAMGHFACHYCGFEEYHPLKVDPRAKHDHNQLNAAELASHQHSLNAMRYQQQAAALNAYGSAGLMARSNGVNQPPAPGKSIPPGMGPIWGMTEAEKQALYRLYNDTMQKKIAPPMIVGSKAEASALMKLDPVEQRQTIIQKLRDLGKI